jgi:D-arabinose 1-dehydrogenase-like Zn-dependent alcohol dehydrogenase
MKAAVLEKTNVLKVWDHLPQPQIGDYEALCELLFGATCSGTDSHIIRGVFPWISPLPTILGHESVGRVIKIGPKVRNYQIGDLVTRVGATPIPEKNISITWGGFAQFGVARDHWAMCADGRPAGEWQGSRWNQIVPPSISPEVAPMLTTWRETYSYLFRMGISPSTRILILGSGGNGLSFAAHAVNLGVAQVALLGAPYMAAKAKKLGVHHFIDYHTADPIAPLLEANPEKFDIILDSVGQKGQIDRVFKCLKPGGKVAIYGIDDFGKVTLDPSKGPGPFMYWSGGYDEAETHQVVTDMVRQGKLDVSIWYDTTQAYPLTQIMTAFEDVWARKTVKALIKLTEGQ